MGMMKQHSDAMSATAQRHREEMVSCLQPVKKEKMQFVALFFVKFKNCLTNCVSEAVVLRRLCLCLCLIFFFFALREKERERSRGS